MSKKKDKIPKAVNKKESYSPSMLKTYREVVVPNMVSKFNYENSMQVPKLLSIALSHAVILLLTRHMAIIKINAGINAKSHKGRRKWKSWIILAGIKISIRRVRYLKLCSGFHRQSLLVFGLVLFLLVQAKG